MTNKPLPEAATDPLYECDRGDATRSPVEALDILADIESMRQIAQQRKPEVELGSVQASGSYTAWLQRKKPR